MKNIITILLMLNIAFAGITITTSPKEMTFTNEPIKGITLKCINSGSSNESKTTTDSYGNFILNTSCQSIEFSINEKIILGTLSTLDLQQQNYKNIYLTTLAGHDVLDTLNKKVINIAKILYAFDSDSDDSNGFQIVANNIISTVEITENTTDQELVNIIKQSKPNFTINDLKPEICILVHLENFLRINGFDIDKSPPCTPVLYNENYITSGNNLYVGLKGEPLSKIFINGVDSNETINKNGYIRNFKIPTPITKNKKHNISITYKDFKGQSSAALEFVAFNDVDQPLFTNLYKNNTINFYEINNTKITDLEVSDSSLNEGYTIDFRIEGEDANNFYIENNSLFFKDIENSKTEYKIIIKAIDAVYHYQFINITLIPN